MKQQKNVPGNYFNKYEYQNKNVLAKIIIGGFIKKIRKLVKMQHPKSILDIGCADGYITNIFSQYTEKIIGSDLEASEISKAKKNYPKIPFRVIDATKIPFKSDSFDMVTAIETLEHIPNPDVAISELHRVTKRVAVLSVPYEPWWRIMNVLRLKYWKHLGNTPGHVNNWTKSGFRKTLNKKFKSVKITVRMPWLIAVCHK